MEKDFNVAIDCSLPITQLEKESQWYVQELFQALANRPGRIRFTLFTDLPEYAPFTHEKFAVQPLRNFDETMFNAIWQLDYSSPALVAQSSSLPRIVFVDHIAPLGLKSLLYDSWPETEQRRYREVLKSWHRDPTLILTSSEWMKRDIIIWSGASPNTVVPLLAGVPSMFAGAPVPFTPQELLNGLGITGRYILCWLDDEIANGFELTFAAFIENAKTFSDCCLLVCFSQSFEMLNKVQAWCQQNGRSDVKFVETPDKTALKELLADAVCLSHPQHYDGFNLKILAAMSQACPVLTTRSSSFPEVAADTALYTNPGDAIELASHMHFLLNDAGDRSAIKNKTFVRSQNFKWEDVAAKAVEAIEKWLPEAHIPQYTEAKL